MSRNPAVRPTSVLSAVRESGGLALLSYFHRRARAAGLAAVLVTSALVLAACGEPTRCGPARGSVGRVIDGDTLELTSGERVRYLLVDTPESSAGESECHGTEAREFNRSLVHGREIELRYDRECRDRYDRLLAYVSVGGREVNSLLVEQGYACVLHIPPNGNERAREFESLEALARSNQRGLWRCEAKPCR